MADHQVLASAVVDLAAADDSAGVAAALRGLRETERRAVWKALRSRGLSTTAATVAALGCAPGAKSAADAAWAAFLDVEVAPSAVQVLADRLPAWLDDLATRLVAQEVGAAWGFVVVRGLVRDGIIAAPTDPAYVLAMVWGVAPANAHFPAPLDGLRADPALLEGELWELLGAERAGRQLAWADGWRSEGGPAPGTGRSGSPSRGDVAPRTGDPGGRRGGTPRPSAGCRAARDAVRLGGCRRRVVRRPP